jgi:hypothetical protein
MLSDNFDKKIKTVLEQESTASHEKTWPQMETLLDKHLPQKKDNRRRFILFFFLFLVAGSGIYFLVNSPGEKPAAKDNSISSTGPVVSPRQEKTNTDKPRNAEKKLSTEPTIQKETTSQPEAPVIVSNAENKPVKKTAITPKQRTTLPDKKVNYTTTSSKRDEETIQTEISVINAGTAAVKKPVENSINKPETENIKKTEQEKNVVITEGENKLVTENKTTETEKPNTPEDFAPAKKKTPVLSKFFISLSAGPDVSAVGFRNTGKLKTVTGAGIGYKISDRLSVRTGFYTARKIYEAAPEDYNPPAAFWNYYPNLKHIDADCKVYEIPVSIDLHFPGRKQDSWFVSTGLSSLLMKKEEYDYYFKPAYSPNYVYYKRSYENQNQHYFSILNFSGGYSRKINNQLSLQAEPYMKIAMDGVGYGKVKLNSGGILFSAVIKPFAARKK